MNESSRLQNAQHFLRGLRWWDTRCPFSQAKRQKTAREREMHRLIREKWKLWGWRQLFHWRAFFQRDENKIGTPPSNFREGKSHGTESESWVGGPFGNGSSSLVPPGVHSAPTPSLGEASCSCAREGGFTLTPDRKQLGVLLAVLLAAESSAHS